jgi:hypothetical protein
MHGREIEHRCGYSFIRPPLSLRRDGKGKRDQGGAGNREGSDALKCASLVGRKLGQQMRPVALDNTANFRVDFRDVIETGFNLLPDHFQVFGLQRLAMQKFNRHVRVTRQS